MKFLYLILLILPGICQAQVPDTVYYKWLGHDSIMIYSNKNDTIITTNTISNDENIDVDAATRHNFILAPITYGHPWEGVINWHKGAAWKWYLNSDTIEITSPIQIHYIKIGTAVYTISELFDGSIQIIQAPEFDNWHSIPSDQNLYNYHVIPYIIPQ